MAPCIKTVCPSDLPQHRCCEDQRGREGWDSWWDELRCLVWSGCGSLAFLFGGRIVLGFRWSWGQGRSQPQTEEDDEVTDVERGRAALSGRVGVPRKLDQTQDQDPEQKPEARKHGINIWLSGGNESCGLVLRLGLTWAGGPVSWLLHSRAGRAACGSTRRRTGSAMNGWSTFQWS